MFVPFTYIFVCCNDMRESSDYNNFYLGLRNFAIAIAIASVKLHKSQHRMQFFMHGETSRHVPARLVTSQAPNVSGGFPFLSLLCFPILKTLHFRFHAEDYDLIPTMPLRAIREKGALFELWACAALRVLDGLDLVGHVVDTKYLPASKELRLYDSLALKFDRIKTGF